MKQYQDLKLNTFFLNLSQPCMFRPTQPSSGVLKFGQLLCFPCYNDQCFHITVCLNEVCVVSPPMPHVLSFFGMPFACQLCSMDVAL
jgi:hypothetical protein